MGEASATTGWWLDASATVPGACAWGAGAIPPDCGEADGFSPSLSGSFFLDEKFPIQFVQLRMNGTAIPVSLVSGPSKALVVIMAEAVRALLESQVEELEDLRRRGIFDVNEIKYCAVIPCKHGRQIVRKRKAFEYALRRRQPQLKDFLKYIQVTEHM
jgi:hypothetical protein